MHIKPLLLSCFIIILAGCSVTKSHHSNTVDPQINNIVWEIVSYKGIALNAKNFPNGLPAIAFNMQDGKISGNDGCNSFMGVATYRNNTINVGPMASTKTVCPGNTVQQDIYILISSPGLTYRLTEGTLRLFVNDAEIMALKERM